ncbi:Nitrogen fixation protein NifU [Hyella patelloides LEGE 07179]|uniref:Nitrogen fixation protein NifU n=1 Tax=Hyella patelloides LEGE 07179 TaxID=945734 RepID=A0A563W0X3_9CYAN|nr:Fe-S cluster assembly protein NifU [Hyella patelloides]VEP17349.1 Nitrogen fixation protein NifU [Hyella patelloides LEGE 07179]
MWDYTDKVMEHFHNPRNQGKITEKQEGEEIVTGQVGSIACGDALKLHLKIDEETQTIKDATFQTFGCASAIASSSALTELLKGRKVDEAMKLTNKEIAESLGGLPEEKMHCSVMGQEALEAAIYTYKGIPLDDHEEDEGNLICRCFGISDTKIKRIIRENSLTTAEQVTNYVKAGGGCSSCLPDIDDLIEEITTEQETATVEQEKSVEAATEVWTNRDSSSVETSTTTQTTKTLTNLQKITLIQQVIDTEIRPILAEDGGDMELFDVVGDVVKVILKGACSGCASSTETLKLAIEATLQDRVLSTLTVESV